MEKNPQNGILTQKSPYKTIFEGDLYYDVRLGGEDNFWIGDRERVEFMCQDKSFLSWLWDALGEPTRESGTWRTDGANTYWREYKGVRITVERIIE